MALKWHNVKRGDLPATEGTYYCYWPHPDGSPYYANLYFDGVKFQDGLVMMWRELDMCPMDSRLKRKTR